MATSGSYEFYLPIDELIEQSILRAGGEQILGLEAHTAVRALNLLFIDLQNRGILLSSMELVQTTLVSGVATVTLPANTLDILDLVVTQASTDFACTRISWGEYLEIPTKTMPGRPTQYYVNRQREAPLLYLWQVPNNGNYLMKYWQVRFIQTATKLGEDPDLPRRFFPALVAGLAYYLGLNRGMAFPLERLMMLKGEYEEQLGFAMGEDRERAVFKAVPKLRGR